jgi:quinoprotein relay system zinc metallohydrolase 2
MARAAVLSRRQAILGLGAVSLPVRPSRAEARDSAFQEVAPRLYVRFGIHEDVTARNDNAIANIGFIVGRDAVAVVDPGGSLADGRRLRAAIRKVTGLPIRYVVISHGHPDHIFGAGAFEADAPSFIGHHLLPEMLAARGEYYRQRLEATLGHGAAGPVVTPSVLVRDRMDIDLGDRVVGLEAHGRAHTNCDLTVLDQRSGTLFAGDLLFVDRIPSLDGSLRGWLSELAALKSSRARGAVPGHGPTRVEWPAAASALERYLGILLRETREALRAGVELDEAVNTVGRSERGKWLLFDDYHGHNVTQAFKELEWEQPSLPAH